MLINNKRPLRLLLLVGFALLGCSNRGRTISGAKDLADFQEQLKVSSAEQSKQLTNADHSSKVPTKPVVVIGDGMAGAAAAVNLGEEGVRVYGNASFWEDLQGLPEVWQTSLSAQFADAHLADPKQFDVVPQGDRIARNALIAVSLKGLIDAKAAYLRTGPVLPVSEPNGDWKLVDTEGHVEIANEALIVGTGLLRTRRITDAIPGADKVRRALANDGKIKTGDEYLAMPNPGNANQVVGILGAGGNSADCIIHAIAEGHAAKVVVWGEVPPVLKKSKAYRDMDDLYGDKICRVNSNMTDVSYKTGGAIEINRNADVKCMVEKGGNKEDIPHLDLLIESLGRYTGDPPPVVAAAARNRTVTYHPVISGSQLIAVRVSFEEGNDKGATEPKPMYLIGAAATWIPPSVRISEDDLTKYDDSLQETVKAANSGPDIENGPPGFAVAAFMGSHLARECFQMGHLVTNPICQ